GGPAFGCSTPAVGATGPVNCTIATLAAGATATFDLVVHVSRSFTGPLANTASASSATPDPMPANNSSIANAVITPSAAVPTLSPIALALLALALTMVVILKRWS